MIRYGKVRFWFVLRKNGKKLKEKKMNSIEMYDKEVNENQEYNSQLQSVSVAPKSRKIKIFLMFACVGVLISIAKDLIVTVF